MFLELSNISNKIKTNKFDIDINKLIVLYLYFLCHCFRKYESEISTFTLTFSFQRSTHSSFLDNGKKRNCRRNITVIFRYIPGKS